MKKYLSLVKFSHTIFAMPFSMIGFFMAVKNGYNLSWSVLALVVLCMVFARNAAMAFNRLIDADIDLKNKRTANREIPAGDISKSKAQLFIFINIVAFVISTYLINEVCFYLSPIALFVILFYSYTKRFTSLCHLVLGLGLAIAPAGAYLALSSELSLEILAVSIIVLSWVSGFDIIYALQDISFDKNNKLNSIPSYFGVKGAKLISILLHSITAAMVFYLGIKYEYTTLYFIGTVLFCLALIFQHLVIKFKGMKAINLAFFTLNGIASVGFGIFTILAYCLK